MRKLLIITCISFLIFACWGIVRCAKGSLADKVHEIELDNGMKWFLVKRGHAPIFAGVLQVKVGGVDEKEGKSGLAHMFEHMAFKGTTKIGTKDYKAEKEIMDKIDHLIKEGKNEEAKKLAEEQRKYIIPNELWDIFTRNGASNLNAYTSKDVTEYHAEMPSSKLELWLYLNSEMVKDPAFREFYTERDVVLEEQRMSIDNNPMGSIYKTLQLVAFGKSPYRWPTIGIHEDVSSLTREDLKKFYKENYLPECMIGALVGDFEIDEAEKLIKKYFGDLKGKSKVCHREINIDPPQLEEIEAEINFEAEPMLLIGYHKPTVPHFDDYVFDVYSYLLCEGESSRLVKKLVKEEKLAKSISCFNSYPGTRLPNLFVVYAEPFDVKSIEELELAIFSELESLANEPISAEEFEKIKNQMKTDFLLGIDTNYELAHLLVYFENIAGDWRYILNHPKNIDMITAEDLMESAKRYFVPSNRVIVTLRRKDG